MRILISLILLACFSLSANAQAKDSVLLFSYFKGNGVDGLHFAYSVDGYKWIALKKDSAFVKPTAGKDKLMRDPCIMRDDKGVFHMVWTVSWNEKGIGYATSNDLVHWTEQRYLPLMEKVPGARNCWAPEIIYEKKTGIYMIYWATTVTGKFKETESKLENGYNHRIYYVTTYDFKTFTDPDILYDQEFSVIDATIAKNGKQYVMFLKDETPEPPQKNIRLATSDQLTGGYSRPSAPFTGKEWAEGPTVAKVDGWWMVYFDLYWSHKMGAMRSKDLKIWSEVTPRLSFPGGVRHGTVLSISKAELEVLLKE